MGKRANNYPSNKIIFGNRVGGIIPKKAILTKLDILKMKEATLKISEWLLSLFFCRCWRPRLMICTNWGKK